MKCNTHLKINNDLCGTVTTLEEGRCVVTLTTTPEMGADAQELVHGGFVFGMADYAAMCAVNDPYVVLGGAETSFLKPVRVGDSLTAEAMVNETKGRKRIVPVTIRRGQEEVFKGTFTCFVLETHVLGENKG
ncbi:hotdog domain-containing protein [Desulfoluna spongiiphila]|uniref:Thioesterase superfamily n=1 Tax=Desulfoluna spongiiphila TaxID=419481 RepID=A0A1G5HRK4_9BACT|nr:hotdog domain-containing protein [Desulfoluna spongiiphila]SCY66387.1 Thioesterase superfamily [Desulfoluna spongiiphila]